ncbi:hypothetical protein T459_25879 [Capsicum annuum]|uniref:Copia protein n=1 Tax=Capsicum annuum TaxID=4072 RepID=A0A2G2YM49_CAPAN|nr:hypothetical protein T459_25879 [Capsicum annuum]
MEGSTILYGDNTSAIRIATNPMHHENTKHIDVDCHYIRELVEGRSINLRYIYPLKINWLICSLKPCQKVDTIIFCPNSCFVIQNISLREGIDVTLFKPYLIWMLPYLVSQNQIMIITKS